MNLFLKDNRFNFTHLSIAFDEATKSHLSQSLSSPCMCFTCHSWDFSVRKQRSHWTQRTSVYGTRSCARHMWFEYSAKVLNVTSQRVHLNTTTYLRTVQSEFTCRNYGCTGFAISKSGRSRILLANGWSLIFQLSYNLV